MNERTALCASG